MFIVPCEIHSDSVCPPLLSPCDYTAIPKLDFQEPTMGEQSDPLLHPRTRLFPFQPPLIHPSRLATAPLFTGDVVEQKSSIFEDRALLGTVNAQFNMGEGETPSNPEIYINPTVPSSTLIVGSPDSGKSHTASVLLENLILKDQSIGVLSKPLSALVIRVDAKHKNEPCKWACLAKSDKQEGCKIPVTIFVDPSKFDEMAKIYSCIPEVQVQCLTASILPACKPGEIVIVEPTPEFVQMNMSFLLGGFLESKPGCQKVIVFEGAVDRVKPDYYRKRIHTLVEQGVRNQLHVIVSTRNPKTIDPEIIELMSTVIIHKSISPAWFKLLDNHLLIETPNPRFAYPSLNHIPRWSQIVSRLKTGEALVYCPTGAATMRALGSQNGVAFESSSQPGALGSGFFIVHIRRKITGINSGGAVLEDIIHPEVLEDSTKPLPTSFLVSPVASSSAPSLAAAANSESRTSEVLEVPPVPVAPGQQPSNQGGNAFGFSNLTQNSSSNPPPAEARGSAATMSVEDNAPSISSEPFTHVNANENPNAEVNSTSTNSQGLPVEFLPLWMAIQKVDLSSAGSKARPMRSIVAKNLLEYNPRFWPHGKYRKFSEYIEAAVEAKVVRAGNNKRGPWVALDNKWLGL